MDSEFENAYSGRGDEGTGVGHGALLHLDQLLRHLKLNLRHEELLHKQTLKGTGSVQCTELVYCGVLECKKVHWVYSLLREYTV